MSYENVKNSRQRLKQRIIRAMGGKCCICGYDRCDSALELHHLNPEEKDFTIASNTNKAWELIKVEIQKCVMICANCHREIHANLIPQPEHSSYNTIIGDEISEEVKAIKGVGIERRCTHCGKEITNDSKTSLCHDCYAKTTRKVERPEAWQLITEIATSSFVAVGAKYNVSDGAVKKWCKAYGLPHLKQDVIDYYNEHKHEHED